MTTFILSTAKSAGQALIGTAKTYAVNYASRTVSNLLDDRTFEGPRLGDFHLLTSRDGAPMPRVYGRARLAGQVIWASRIKEQITEERVGGKGGPTQTNYTYTMSFAIGLCEGEILGVDRLWINGEPLSMPGLTLRVYTGSDTQLPDPIISAIEGSAAPAFRGTAYMVFEDFPLDEYGARLPQINAEIIRVPPSKSDAPKMEDVITGVNLLPSSGEFAYATDIVEDVTGPNYPVNLNNLAGQADIEQALDQLQTQLPNCRNVSLIISWFGTDLRVGDCMIRPGVERADRLTPTQTWQVCGDTRETAYVISQDSSGRPHYGGTPSDASIIQAIQSLKSRGFRITIYPFILMDILAGNGLPDPYGAAEQAIFPWRGRITSAADLTTSVIAEVDAFFGSCLSTDLGEANGQVTYSGPPEYGFRRFILHYAKLASLAGGVDRFVIGSEMRGLTTLRSAVGAYPAVDKLKSLAADVRTLVGGHTGVTYAADWSEYFGHHVDGNVHFHLDPVWADANIDAVGIDAYFPLSDWRDGEHLDAEIADTSHDTEYLKANMEGGEGYDWYYASQADRDAQIRSPITDGLSSKPWVYRYKDIRNWWANVHHNRVGGVEMTSPTAWVPESKPIWFTEIGCPAIDKGANQPNVFVDPKSSESHAPYYSNGTRDDLMQRRYVEAFLTYWADHNTMSSVYGDTMVDLDAAHIWCWDARPFPDFPARCDVWADGENWQLGHWLTGRTGLIPVRDVVQDIALQAGVTDIDVSRVHGLIEGFVLDRPMSARAALQPLAATFQFTPIECANGLAFIASGSEDRLECTLDDIVADRPGPVEEQSADPEARPLDVRLHFIDRENDYQQGVVSARDRLSESVRIYDVPVPVIMGRAQAKQIAKALLDEVTAPASQLKFSVSPAAFHIEVGDVLTLPDRTGEWQIQSLEGVATKRASARKVTGMVQPTLSGSSPDRALPVPWVSKPELVILDIADLTGEGQRGGILVGAKATPFNPVTISGPDGEVTVTAPIALGELLTPLSLGPVGRWDTANIFDVRMPDIDLASVEASALLNGANPFAVQTDTGWEILQAQNIELVGVDTYRLSHLLRGLAGTDADCVAQIPTGATIVYLGRGVADLPINIARIGETINIAASAGGRSSDSVSHIYLARHLRPLSPVHGYAVLDDDGLHLSWIRRTRIGGDSWAGLDVPLGEEQELYRVELIDGEGVFASYICRSTTFQITQAELLQMPAVERVRISQISNVFGYGTAMELDIN